MRPLSPDEAFARAASRCALREYCRADWRDKLRAAGLGSGDIEAVLDRLEDEGYIDEVRYARAFVHDKSLYDLWGRLKIRQALHLKRIPAAAIDEALAAIDETVYRDGLRDLLNRKSRTLRAGSDYERRMKLARFAAGRGFEPALVFSLLGDDTD